MEKMRQWIGFVVATSCLLSLLIVATEGAIYLDFHYYEKEYRKYEVLDDLQMEMEDVMDVTREMMSYLHGKREDLVVHTVVNGKEQEFFNDQDKFHMAEVKAIFQKAIWIRRISLTVMVIGIILLLFLKGNWMQIVAKWNMVVSSIFVAGGVLLAYFVSKDFELYFILFHEIFFDNDLWMFDPETDLMIRMLPEGLFMDFAVRIGIFSGILLALFFFGSFLTYRMRKKKYGDTK